MNIVRNLEQNLLHWHSSKTRKPLLVRGARQVGKSFLIETFGRRHFEHCIVINFEIEPEYKKCFQTLDPKHICDAIKVLTQQPIIPGKTLLFFDEIQDCPEAIQSLRYFKEKMPELHVIGAGSLLEPVLSFKEFIGAVNPAAKAYIENCTLDNPVPDAIHAYLLEQVRKYFFIGGMPEVLASYIQSQDLQEVQAIQASIIATYRNDFGHYVDWANPKLLQQCFDQIPRLSGQLVKYNRIDPDIRSRDLKEVLHVLEDAGIAHRVQATAASGLPLDAVINERKFKMIFIDIGLVKRVLKLDAAVLLNDPLVLLNRGSLAEQFVGQELLASSKAFEKEKLYFWTRDGAGQAEVDYIVNIGTRILPIEVKAGKTGTLRSLKQYILERTPEISIRVSEQPLMHNDGLLSVPLYLISELPRLIL